MGYPYGKVQSCGTGRSCICVKLTYTASTTTHCGGEGEPCCQPPSCIDYQGNKVSSGGCGYPTQQDANTGELWYCKNGVWVSTLAVCLTNLYSSCESLGFAGSCGGNPSPYIDPPGSRIGSDYCYKSVSVSTPSQCNSGLICCPDGICRSSCEEHQSDSPTIN